MGSIEQRVFEGLLYGGFAVAGVVFVTLLFVTAPYGRHTRKGWGPLLSDVWCWLLMECVAMVAPLVFFLIGNGFRPGWVWLLVVLWEVHYVHRALIYPFRMGGRRKHMPLAIPLMAVVFNTWNAYLNGRYLGVHADLYNAEWLSSPHCIAGVLIFIVGSAINIHSDEILFRLRAPGEMGYRIPYGGFYRWVSCPNYFGELLAWAGWALAAWSLPALFFVVWTAANLVPRALAHQRWYRKTFADYPPERKALIPFLF